MLSDTVECKQVLKKYEIFNFMLFATQIFFLQMAQKSHFQPEVLTGLYTIFLTHLIKFYLTSYLLRGNTNLCILYRVIYSIILFSFYKNNKFVLLKKFKLIINYDCINKSAVNL